MARRARRRGVVLLGAVAGQPRLHVRLRHGLRRTEGDEAGQGRGVIVIVRERGRAGDSNRIYQCVQAGPQEGELLSWMLLSHMASERASECASEQVRSKGGCTRPLAGSPCCRAAMLPDLCPRAHACMRTRRAACARPPGTRSRAG